MGEAPYVFEQLLNPQHLSIKMERNTHLPSINDDCEDGSEEFSTEEEVDDNGEPHIYAEPMRIHTKFDTLFTFS